MTSPETERKLTAVFVTDVVGYSRLMGDDHDGTVKTLSDYRAVFSSHIQQHKGRVVNAPGDSILAEFVSVVDAVTAAVEIQRELAGRNEGLPEQRRMHFRIGVNLGDVLIKEGELFGDGVNIAARLESLADPGGVCISRTVYDQVHTRLDLDYDYLGEHKVKNIATPVRAYKVLLDPGQAPTRTERAVRKLARGWRKGALVATVAVLVALVAVLAWNLYRQSVIDSALAAFQKDAAFPLPDVPSIAVLAFDNLSGDPKQEYFSDGLSENIITRLTTVSRMLVIARNSSFSYKGKGVDVRRIGREMGVRYVLEGSVQKSGRRIRVTAQLIDAATGRHLWAQKYDREMKELFAVQDEITRKVVTELQVKLTMGEMARILARETENVAAHDLYLHGLRKLVKFNKEENRQARDLFEQAIALDPNFAGAISMVGWTYLFDVLYRFGDNPDRSLNLAEKMANRAIAIDGSLGTPHKVLSRVYSVKREFRQAIIHGRKATSLQPNDANAKALLSYTLILSGSPREAVPLIQQALRSHPYPPAFFRFFAGSAYYFNGEFKRAIAQLKKYLEQLNRGPQALLGWQLLIASYMELGQEDTARAEVLKLLREKPGLTMKNAIKVNTGVPFKDYAFLERLAEKLRAAGLPE